jgi:hypothetical protein
MDRVVYWRVGLFLLYTLQLWCHYSCLPLLLYLHRILFPSRFTIVFLLSWLLKVFAPTHPFLSQFFVSLLVILLCYVVWWYVVWEFFGSRQFWFYAVLVIFLSFLVNCLFYILWLTFFLIFFSSIILFII